MWDDNDAKLREAGIPVPEYHHYEWYLEEKDSDLKEFRNRLAWLEEDEE